MVDLRVCQSKRGNLDLFTDTLSKDWISFRSLRSQVWTAQEQFWFKVLVCDTCIRPICSCTSPYFVRVYFIIMSSTFVAPTNLVSQRRRNFIAAQWRVSQKRKNAIDLSSTMRSTRKRALSTDLVEGLFQQRLDKMTQHLGERMVSLELDKCFA